MKEESILTPFADTEHKLVITVSKNKEEELIFTAGPAFIKTDGDIARRRIWMHSKLDEWINEQLIKEQA
jgi:hypothetical protein